MTTTVEIPEDILQRAILMTCAHFPQEAVLKAIEEFVKPRDQRSLIPLLGTFESFMTSEELENMRSERLDRHGVD